MNYLLAHGQHAINYYSEAASRAVSWNKAYLQSTHQMLNFSIQLFTKILRKVPQRGIDGIKSIHTILLKDYYLEVDILYDHSKQQLKEQIRKYNRLGGAQDEINKIMILVYYSIIICAEEFFELYDKFQIKKAHTSMSLGQVVRRFQVPNESTKPRDILPWVQIHDSVISITELLGPLQDVVEELPVSYRRDVNQRIDAFEIIHDASNGVYTEYIKHNTINQEQQAYLLELNKELSIEYTELLYEHHRVRSENTVYTSSVLVLLSIYDTLLGYVRALVNDNYELAAKAHSPAR